MIRSLRLRRFKSFRDATLHLGPLTVLIGANASGKSNVRDAFRFLHGIGRGYSLAEKYAGGQRIWDGIRGGTHEIAFVASEWFGIDVRAEIVDPAGGEALQPATYATRIEPITTKYRPPRMTKELFKSNIFDYEYHYYNGKAIFSSMNRLGSSRETQYVYETYSDAVPAIIQASEDEKLGTNPVKYWSNSLLKQLLEFRFLDPSPAQMRLSSIPGLTTLGDQGENLSSVLATIWDDAGSREAVLQWVRRLTPMDVDGLGFYEDPQGKIALQIKERDGRSVSIASVSDGTLRFLCILAALFGPDPAQLYFIEELENGIHPTRLGLLVELIESQARRRGIQVVATSHAPLVLQFLSEEALGDASVVYRLPDRADSQIRRILDVPEAARVINEQGAALLHASSWFEDALYLTEDGEAEVPADETSA